ncbi:hypothetical protein [Rhabdaerophilum sp.]|uniref:hypothetical protein n=1 Tax=Rhabdaerophilum sp. TaxID=2717341 RepID=UPI0038D36B56
MNTQRSAIDYDFHRSHAQHLRREAMHAFFRKLVQSLHRRRAKGMEMDLFQPRVTLPRV